MSAFLVWNYAIPGSRATVRRQLAWKVPTWRAYLASSDPIAAGSLTENAHGTTPAGRDRPSNGDRYQPVGVHNRRSIFFDHTTYCANLEEFVAGLAHDLAVADGVTGLKVTDFSLDAGRGERTIRTLSLALLRFCSALVAASVLLVLWLRAGPFPVLGEDTAVGRAARDVVQNATIAGVAMVIVLLAAAWLAASFGWRIWNRSALRVFPRFRDNRPYIPLSFWWAACTTPAAGAALGSRTSSGDHGNRPRSVARSSSAS